MNVCLLYFYSEKTSSELCLLWVTDSSNGLFLKIRQISKTKTSRFQLLPWIINWDYHSKFKLLIETIIWNSILFLINLYFDVTICYLTLRIEREETLKYRRVCRLPRGKATTLIPRASAIFPFSTKNSLLGKIWSKKIKIVSLSWNLVSRLILICKIQW